MDPRALLLVATLAFAACGAPVPQQDVAPPQQAGPGPVASPFRPLPVIPHPYLGIWDISASACAGPPGEQRLQIEPGRITFNDSVALVESVNVRSDSVEIVLAFVEEGQKLEETLWLRLPDEGRLGVETSAGRSVRVRCGAPPPASAAAAFRWTTSSSGEGDSLSMRVHDDEVAFHLFCPARSNDLLVNVPGLRPVASEERMTIGSGSLATALVADVAGDAVRGGVSATGPVPAELDEILTGGQGIGVSYGSQTRSFPPPPAEAAGQFLRGCRD